MEKRLNKRRTRVVVAGATGFVGRALGPLLAERFDEVIGLTRSPDRDGTRRDGYLFKTADLFSLLDCEQAVEGATHVVYLVHSMTPSARLTQASFRDMDLICADNMARAASAAGVAQIVYLSGLIPSDVHLSEHLASRHEVERVLGAYGVPVTTLRAGMVLGAEGSSFQIMSRLVRRLPAMVCPRWTSIPTQPVALADVVRLLDFCVDNPDVEGEIFDVGCPESMSYRQMMAKTAELMGLKRPMVRVPVLSPGLSRLWVSVVTGAPRALVKPLVQSMKHPMTARDHRIYRRAGFEPTSFEDAMRAALAEEKPDTPAAFSPAPKSRERVVRSVQRLPLPSGLDALWAAERYVSWLPDAMRPFFTAQLDGDLVKFHFLGIPAPVLVLRFSAGRSRADRQLFYIVGGLLVKDHGRGRLEFREVPGEQTLITAIHDFYPSLPWFLYIATQAPAHQWVMQAFGRHLKTISDDPSGGVDGLANPPLSGDAVADSQYPMA